MDSLSSSDLSGEAAPAVDGGTLLMSAAPSAVPSVQSRPVPSNLIRYYALRVTTPHADLRKVQDVFDRFSKEYLIGKHGGHGDEPGETAEHFHCIFIGMDANQPDNLKKALRIAFGRGGNAFYSGKWMDNTVYKAIQYMRHEDNVQFKWRGVHWNDIIDDSPDWDPNLSTKKVVPEVKERPSFPTLTMSNVLKQALKFRQNNAMRTTDLRVVLEAMTRQGWQPHISIMRTGLDPLHFRLFTFHCNDRQGVAPNWWDPRTI